MHHISESYDDEIIYCSITRSKRNNRDRRRLNNENNTEKLKEQQLEVNYIQIAMCVLYCKLIKVLRGKFCDVHIIKRYEKFLIC